MPAGTKEQGDLKRESHATRPPLVRTLEQAHADPGVVHDVSGSSNTTNVIKLMGVMQTINAPGPLGSTALVMACTVGDVGVRNPSAIELNARYTVLHFTRARSQHDCPRPPALPSLSCQ